MKNLNRTQGATPLIAGIVLLLALSGCATSSTPNAEAPSTASPSTAAISSEAQAADVMKTCMAERGYVENPGGGYSVPNEQAEKMNADLGACSDKVDAGTAPWDDADWSKVFAENVASATCLTDHGYSVPDQPSLQTFRDTYGKAGMWDPYANVPLAKVQSVINSECPQPEPVW
ncbi:hypothetical protein [Glaciihabitans sp. dw_435]|uniref:hypothetical protein n=1 Tax=Glaciihabitans sp. dw_435 TaxID=2720081 RepID=UPI001BD1E20D|nr:hypothetical protein [Glaciihabitans sp. dw_435]